MEGMIRRNLAEGLADILDQWAWSGQVLRNETPGIFALSGSNVTAPSAGTNGDTANWELIAKMVDEMSRVNRSLTSSVRWGLSSLLAVRLQGTRRTTGALGVPDPIMTADGNIARMPSLVSANFLNDQRKGSARNLSGLVLGNFTNFVMGFWGQTRIVVDPYTYGRRGYTAIGIETLTSNAIVDANSFVRAGQLVSAY